MPLYCRTLTSLVGCLTIALCLCSAQGEEAIAPSFRQDVIPILTKTGCNAGSCHGRLSGQNGFRLSLRGYAPEQDYEWLTSELSSRRIDFAQPAQSLVLRKPLGQVPHEGGRRFTEDSRAAKVLLAWISARAPGPDPAESDASTLELSTDDKTMAVGQTDQLKVIAHWPDGTSRDVTWVAQYFSNDPAVASVDEDGLIKCVSHGATSIRVHFQGIVKTVMVTSPFEAPVDPSLYVAANNEIDRAVFSRLQSLHVPPAPLCDDSTFVRRVYFDLIGTMPTADEVRAFLADSSSDKRSKLADALLQRPEYAEYWALQMSDLLQNRRERDHDVRGAKGTRSMHDWLRQQMAANRHWDDLARDVLTATGDAVANPQIGYYIVLMGEKQNVEESDVADSVAQAFLGTRIGCARCHNHPLERYTQDDYYHFTAFFARTTMKRAEAGKGPTELLSVSRDAFNQYRTVEAYAKQVEQAEQELLAAKGNDITASQKKLTELLKREQEAYASVESSKRRPPMVTQPRTGKPMNPQPLDRSVPEIPGVEDARIELAAWITDPKNEAFSSAMANRLWKHFMSVGLVEPVDDFRSSNPPSNPALLKYLSGELAKSSFDLKHVMRLIVNSRTYQLSSETNADNQTDHHYYSHYFARRLPAEVMSDAISEATGMPETFPGYPMGVRAIQLPEPAVNSYFLSLFGRSDRVTACACERSGEITLPQLLHLTNGDDILTRIESPDGRLYKVLSAQPDDAKATEEIFLSVFGRLPADSERKTVEKAISARATDSRQDVFRDLMWALINSKEFAFNH